MLKERDPDDEVQGWMKKLADMLWFPRRDLPRAEGERNPPVRRIPHPSVGAGGVGKANQNEKRL